MNGLEAGLHPALGLAFLLGLRHGLDPDHVTVIDAFVFRAAQVRPRLAAWVGGLFALGHGVSVAVVAVAAALLALRFSWPSWTGPTVDWLVIALLVAVGLSNLAALGAAGEYRPVGWRSRLLPARVRETVRPGAVFAVGLVFGLAFETATQAAAWGAAASGAGGLGGALAIAAAFTAGMVLTDTADSLVMTRLLGSGGDPARIGRYRRGVGAAIVALAFGMAGYALAGKVATPSEAELSAMLLAGGIIAAAAAARLALIGRAKRG